MASFYGVPMMISVANSRKSAPCRMVVMGLALAGLTAYSAPLLAESNIGMSTSVENNVTGTLAGSTRTLNEGSTVFSNDLIKTDSASLARLTFRDNTNLSLGPSSGVKLDRFVFDPDESASSVVLNTTRGAFRFVTGNSDPRAFRINTPVATIGIRGTVLDINNSTGQTIVVLKRGATHVCVQGSKSLCADLTKVGQYVIVTKKGVDGPLEDGGKIFDFRTFCSEQHFSHWDACDIGLRPASYDNPAGHSGQPPATPSAPRKRN